MTRPANLGRDFKPDDPKVAEFIAWVETTDKETWLSYLVINGLDAHLSKYVHSSPFSRGTHLDRRMIQLIHKFWPELTTIEDNTFRHAVQSYIREHELIQKAFPDYRPPQ